MGQWEPFAAQDDVNASIGSTTTLRTPCWRRSRAVGGGQRATDANAAQESYYAWRPRMSSLFPRRHIPGQAWKTWRSFIGGAAELFLEGASFAGSLEHCGLYEVRGSALRNIFTHEDAFCLW